MNVDEYIKNIDGAMQVIAEKLRAVVMASNKEFTEEMKWNVPTYSLNKNICSIMVHKSHVNLQLFLGAKIKDAGDLIGTGKTMRHLSYKNLADINEKQIMNYLTQLIKLD